MYTNDTILIKFREIHGALYDYSRMMYTHTRNNITEYENMLEAYTEEQNILSHSMKFRPKIKFGGHTECIKKGLT